MSTAELIEHIKRRAISPEVFVLGHTEVGELLRHLESVERMRGALMKLAPDCEECGKMATHKEPWTEGYYVCRDHADCDVVLRNPIDHPATQALNQHPK